MTPGPAIATPDHGKRRTRHVAAAMILFAAAMSGCASGVKEVPAASPVAEPSGGHTVRADAMFGSTRTPSVSERATTPFIFRSSQPAGAGFMRLERTPLVTDADGRHTCTTRRSLGPASTGPWTPSVEQRVVFTAEGHAAIAEEINHDERVELVYEPAMVILPAALEPGGPSFDQTVHMTVHPLGDRGRVKAEGTARQTIAHGGSDTVQAGSVSLPAQRIRLTFTATLKPAEVSNITLQWYAPDGALVAERREERTRVFGVQTRRNRESWIIDR